MCFREFALLGGGKPIQLNGLRRHFLADQFERLTLHRLEKPHGFGMPKSAYTNRQKWPFLTTAGGHVFSMAGFAADLPKWPPNRAVSGVIERLVTLVARGYGTNWERGS